MVRRGSNGWVLIEGTMGSCKRIAKVTPMIHPKTIMVPHAGWLPEEKGDNENPYRVWDLNCNQLIPMGYNDSSGFDDRLQAKARLPRGHRRHQAATMWYGDLATLAGLMEEKPHAALFTPR